MYRCTLDGLAGTRTRRRTTVITRAGNLIQLKSYNLPLKNCIFNNQIKY